MTRFKCYVIHATTAVVLFFNVSSSYGVQVHVESSGEGNFIWISHGPKEAEEVIFVDGGTSEYKTIARRTAHIPQEEKKFKLKPHPPQETVPTFQTAELLELHEDQGDSSSMASGESMQKPENEENAANRTLQIEKNSGSKRSAEEEAEGGPSKKAARQSSNIAAAATRSRRPSDKTHQLKYRDDLLTRIYGSLPERTDPTTGAVTKQVKTVLITHPDRDHYGWFRFLFEADLTKDRSNFCIQDLILSGFYEDYGEDFQKWVEACEASKRIARVTCTGMADGSKKTRDSVREQWVREVLSKEAVHHPAASSSSNQAAAGSSMALTPPVSLFARPYCSAIPVADKSTIEKRIENALKWKEEEAEETTPKIQILVMNAGHSFAPPERPDLVRSLKSQGNLNSIILRVAGAKS